MGWFSGTRKNNKIIEKPNNNLPSKPLTAFQRNARKKVAQAMLKTFQNRNTRRGQWLRKLSQVLNKKNSVLNTYKPYETETIQYLYDLLQKLETNSNPSFFENAYRNLAHSKEMSNNSRKLSQAILRKLLAETLTNGNYSPHYRHINRFPTRKNSVNQESNNSNQSQSSILSFENLRKYTPKKRLHGVIKPNPERPLQEEE